MFTNASFKDLERLDKNIRERILTELKSLSSFPLDSKRDIKKLKGLGKNIYRLRVGEFRVIYFLSDIRLVVLRIIDRKDLVKIINTMKFD
jgi:mRNA-degrading endonuclease RelE of RelBE toxin-antitoxin system